MFQILEEVQEDKNDFKEIMSEEQQKHELQEQQGQVEHQHQYQQQQQHQEQQQQHQEQQQRQTEDRELKALHEQHLQQQEPYPNVFHNDQCQSGNFYYKCRQNIVLFYGVLFLGVAGLIEGPFVIADIPIDRIEQWLPESAVAALTKYYLLYYSMKIAGPVMAAAAMGLSIYMLVRSWRQMGQRSRWMRWPVLVLTCVAVCIGFPVSSVGFVVFSIFGGLLTFYAGHCMPGDTCKDQQSSGRSDSVAPQRLQPVVLSPDPTGYKQSIP